MEYKKQSYSPGFTIVELLIVIVVIGILAAITMVAYSGIEQRAVVASLASDLSSANKLLKVFQVDNSNYPATINCAIPDTATNKCIKSSNGTTYQYLASNTNPQTFCVTATKNGQSYSVSHDGTPLAGVCPSLRLDAGNSTSYPGTGTSWADLSGNAYTSVLVNGTGYTSADSGALSFDGVDDYVDTNVDLSWSITDSFSMTAWIKITNEGGRLNHIVAKNNYEYTLFSRNSKVGFNYWNSAGADTITVESGVIDVTQWHFVSVTYNGSAGKLYVDGVLVATDDICTGTLQNSTESTKIGIGYAWGYPNRYFKGLLGGVSFYNSSLSDKEIQLNFNALRGRYGV